MRNRYALPTPSRSRVLLHVAAPVVLACALYYFGRPLGGFAVAHVLPLLGAAPVVLRLPPWMLFNLPDGLWLYGFMTANVWIWRGEPARRSWFWIAIVPVLGFGSEAAQAAHVIPGTFDPLDLLVYALATALALWHLSSIHLPHIHSRTAG